MNPHDLYSAYQLGPLHLPNRFVMAPMTRCRAGAGNVPTDTMARYYQQRASAGLIVTEATQVAPEGVGHPNTPGVHTLAQAEGWKRVTTAVHAAGGRIVAQLWHVGRISHPLFQPNGALPVAPSAIAPAGQVYTPDGPKPYVTPPCARDERDRGRGRTVPERRALIVNGGYDRSRADAVIGNGGADLVSFGQAFLANPDLVSRMKVGAPLNPADASTYYGGGEKGYIDYPELAVR